MKIEILHDMLDTRLDSRSILILTTVGDYLRLAKRAVEHQGGIEGQRGAVKTTSALRIRSRMKDDFIKGAILPPVVLGILVDSSFLDKAKSVNNEMLSKLLDSIDDSRISIIDGMQRTIVFFEHQADLMDRELRVELWFVKESSSLIYRMLVLNTGQVPWSLRRQVEVINASLLSDIKYRLQQETKSIFMKGHTQPLSNLINIHKIDTSSRRTNPGEFQANEVIEMYLAFGLRKEKMDTETILADQFSRLDLIEAVSDRSFVSAFVNCFIGLNRLDFSFSNLRKSGKKTQLFFEGRNLFDSHPACIGFIVAAAQKIYGRPGSNTKDSDAQVRALAQVVSRCEQVSKFADTLSMDQLEEFLDFNVLNELSAQPAGKHGDFARELFTEAFRVFFGEDEITSMTPCWRAH